jgi:hypothetical protein
MASQSKFVYSVEIDASTAEATAQKLAQIYTQALAQIKIPALGSGPEAQAMVAQLRQQQAQITSDVRTASQARIDATRNEADARISQERRVTSELETQARQRKQAASGGLGGELVPGFGSVQGLLGTSILGVGIGAAASQGFQFLSQANQLETSYRRQSIAARELAGSQEKVNQLLNAYIVASGGAVDKATALSQVTKLETLGFADNAQEVSRFTRGARGASLATGRDADYVISQAQLAIANQSTMRLDQLGIGVGEFQKKLADLQATTQGLSKDQLYEEAILDIWESKFGAITDSAEGQATGLEKLGAAWTNFKLSVGDSSWFNNFTGALANSVNALASGPGGISGNQMQSGIQAQRSQIQSRPFMSDAWRQTQDARSNDLGKLVQQSQDLGTRGVAGADRYNAALAQIYSTMQVVGEISDQQAGQMASIAEYYTRVGDAAQQAALDAREYADVAGGVITKQDALAAGYGTLQAAVDAYNATQVITNATMAQTAHWMQVISGGQRWVLNPTTGFGPTTDIPGPQDSFFQRQQALSQGIPLSLGGKDLRTDAARVTQEQYRAKEAADQKAANAREAADNKAAREWEATAKKTAEAEIAAAKKMSDTFESKLGRIAGLTSPSEVTQSDMDLAKQGLYQDKPDEYLRRLMAKANNPTSKDFGDVNFGDAAKAVGMSGDADPKAIAAAFQQAWSTGALWADRSNVGKFLNLGAVQRELAQQKQGEIGQRNLLDYLGMDPRVVGAAGYQGILPGRLMTATDMGSSSMMTSASDAMSTGIGQGAAAGFQKIGSDALTVITQQLTGDQAQAQWDTLGTTIASMMATSIQSAVGQTDIVGTITAAVLQQINDAQDNQP